MPTRRHFLQTGTVALSASALAPNAMAREKASDRPDYAKTDAELITDSSPLADRFRMPGEWEKHEATLMVYPTRQNWLGRGLISARKEWAATANTISEFEPVRMVVDPADTKRTRKALSAEIELIELPVNDGWARDTGPMILKNAKGERRAAGFIFNGWGAKFPPFSNDALLKARLCAKWEMPFYPIDLVAEGGGVLVDGAGTVIATEECLLQKNRNPGVDKAIIEKRVLAGLGAKKMIWLGRGLTPDPITDGHIDGMAAFAAPGVVLLHHCDAPYDPNTPILEDAKRRLQAATDAKGTKLEIIDLPLGTDVVHMNFYICNGAVIVPTSGDKFEDDLALGVLREVFDDRKVVGVTGKVLAKGGGGIHCITQQIPA